MIKESRSSKAFWKFLVGFLSFLIVGLCSLAIGLAIGNYSSISLMMLRIVSWLTVVMGLSSIIQNMYNRVEALEGYIELLETLRAQTKKIEKIE